MVDDDAYCVDIMKQVAAVQSSLEKEQRIVLRNHRVPDAVQSGLGPQIIDELIDAMKYMPFSAGEAMAVHAPLHPLVEGPVCRCHGVQADPGCGEHAAQDRASGEVSGGGQG